MAEESNPTETVEAAAPRRGRPPKKRGLGRPKGSGKKKPARPKATAKRGPGRPKGSGKKKPGRPKGSGKRGPGRPTGSGRKPGRPKGTGRGPGRPKGAGRVTAQAGASPRQVRRIVKAAMKDFQAKLPKLLKRELRKML